MPPGPLASDVFLEPFEARPIRSVIVRGLKTVDMTLVTNQVRSRAGTPLSAELVRADVQRINRLGKFSRINANVQPVGDGRAVDLVFDLAETAIVRDVQVVGNRQVTDSDIAAQVNMLKDTPVDEYQIGAAISRIQRLYREKGYYLATVSVDQRELTEREVVLFRINEGERVKVTDIRFEGNKAFEARQLSPSIKTERAGLFDSGPVDNEVLDRDVASLVEFYKDRGYLDIRADRQLTFSPNGKEAIVTFLVDEGRLYTLRSIKAAVMTPSGQPQREKDGTFTRPTVFSGEQLAGLMQIKAGDAYSADKIRRSLDTIRNAYARMGYAESRVGKAELRDETLPEVDLLLLVREGEPSRTGEVKIRGNALTRSNVILGELNALRPDRPLDLSTRRINNRQVLEIEDRLNALRLFEPNTPRITVQAEDPSRPGYRDVLLEVKETDTGSLGFGAGISSDLGLIGSISLKQDNFDHRDWPDSFDEFISGRAFRGGGEKFNLELAPGTETQAYVLSLTDPTAFDTEYSAGGSVYYRTRQYNEFDEARGGVGLSVGRRFGTRWVGSIAFRYNNIDISDIEDGSAQDLYDVEGNSNLTGLGFTLTRSTIDSRFRPTKGTRIELGVERVGVFGGDYDFTKLSASHLVYFPIDEDFFGRKTVVSLKTEVSYIPEGQGSAPLFERYYRGGNSFRGFRFRTISPKGYQPPPPQGDSSLTSDPVGGIFMFFLGSEIEKPIVDDLLAINFFLDTGTVDEDFTFENYRVSGGFGFRLYIEALSPAPLAFDFGFPILRREGDRERVFSFKIDIPF
ncbi:MAG: outer membrane protein assembly factor [Phycisphaerales bacterium]